MKIYLIFYFIYFATIAVITESFRASTAREERSYEILSSALKVDETLSSPSEISTFINLGLGSKAEPDTPRESLSSRRGGQRFVDPEVVDQLEGNGWLDVIPGTPGKDYPNYRNIPQTSFTCDKKTAGGYYADIEARCQVFHVCNTNGEKSSFMCPSGSIFNQKYFVCDWWYDFECDDATDLYSLNEKLNRGGTGSGPGGPGRLLSGDEEEFVVQRPLGGENFVADGFDLSLAGTGEGSIGYGKGADGYQSNVNSGEKFKENNNDNNNNNNNNNKEKRIELEGFNEKEKSPVIVSGEKVKEVKVERRSDSVNWGRKRFRKEEEGGGGGGGGSVAGENQTRRVGNYEGGEKGEEGRAGDNFRTGNDRRQDRKLEHSMGFKNEFLERRGANDDDDDDDEGDDKSNNDGGRDNPAGEYRRTSSIIQPRNGGEETIVRRFQNSRRIKENRNSFRENNYSAGDYLLGVVMEDEDNRENRSYSNKPIQRGRFLPIL